MKKKETENKLVAVQSGFEMLDNLGDKIIEASLDGATSDVLSAIPGATIAMGLIKGIRRYKDQKNYQKFISFVQNYKSNTDEKISKYLNDHPESELGEYTISMIEDLTSVRQTEMFGKATAALLNGEIDENLFYEYGYIISKLDPYLFSLINNLKDNWLVTENNILTVKRVSRFRAGSLGLRRPNQDLLSFGFLEAIPIDIRSLEKAKTVPEQGYKVSHKFLTFYKRIILGEKCTTSRKQK